MWLLPGPHLYIEKLCAKIRDSGILVFERPENKTDISKAVISHLNEQDICRTHYVKITKNHEEAMPAEILVHQLLAPEFQPVVASAKTIATSRYLEGDVIWIDGIDPGLWQPWNTFLHALSREQNKSDLNYPASLCIAVTAENPLGDAGNAHLAYSGPMGRLDTLIWVSRHLGLSSSSGIENSLIVAVITELCGWNLDLAEHLVHAPVTSLLADPLKLLSQTAKSLPDTSQAVDLWDGQSFPCTLSLIKNRDTLTVSRRVWRAQLSILFPWLEDVRLSIVAQHRSNLKQNFDLIVSGLEAHRKKHIGGIEDFEFNELERSVSGPPKLHELIKVCHKIRNNLAHLSTALYEDIQQAEKLAKILNI